MKIFQKRLLLDNDFDKLIHHLRGRELSKLNSEISGTACHIGCAGKWYFEWISEHITGIEQNIGIEYYLPEPSDLPLNVKWLKETAGFFPSVENDSVDWVFSGQNIEHLWIEDFMGFFLESNRVLKQGGRISIDTPNQTITQAIGWNHSQHFAEFTVEDIEELLLLAGFRIDEAIGLFPANLSKIAPNELLNLKKHSQKWSYFDKAKRNPSQSFIFWINATKMGNPDFSAIEKRATEIFHTALLLRVNRFQDSNWNILKKGHQGFFKVDTKEQFPLRLCLPIFKDLETLTITFLGDKSFDLNNLLVTINGKIVNIVLKKEGEAVAAINFSGETIFSQEIVINSQALAGKLELRTSLKLNTESNNTLTSKYGYELI